ncbi:MAG: hypothetical protein ABDH21_04440 [bacterium]
MLEIDSKENIIFLVISEENKDKLIQLIHIPKSLKISMFSNDEQISNALQGYKQIVWSLNKHGVRTN